MDEEKLKEIVREAIEEILFSEDEFSPYNRLHDRLDDILRLFHSSENVRESIKYADKFDDYMKNIDRLNQMINEFKGLVSIVRGELSKKC